MNPMTRRRFLKTAAAAGVGAAAWQPWLQMQAMAQAASSGAPDYKAMVCVFLFGGNDGNNLLVPRESDQWALYTRARANLALDAGSVLPITPTNTGGRRYGLHPSFTRMQARFQAGQAALLANVGPLVTPTTKAQYEARSVPLPPSLFSHADQQGLWQTDNVEGQVRGGWAGRTLERLVADSTANRGYSCVSVAGSALWGTGDGSLQPYRVPPSGRFGLDAYTPGGTDPLSVALAGLMADVRTDPFEATWIAAMKRAMDNQRILSTALAASTLHTPFPGTELGDQLAMVSKLIGTRQGLGLSRQCFFCAIGGFDTHGDDQMGFQADAFAQIDAAVDAFLNEMSAQGLSDKVTLFTASDFGRTCVSNGRGSDHGWGNHHFVAGGSVVGQRLYGAFPNHTVDGPDDIGGGVWIPALSVDQLGAELGRWFGAGSLEREIFPTSAHFDTQLGLLRMG